MRERRGRRSARVDPRAIWPGIVGGEPPAATAAGGLPSPQSAELLRPLAEYERRRRSLVMAERLPITAGARARC